MRITIVEAEIKLAIELYIQSQITVKEGQEITIEFKNTRGEDGATAEINIGAPTLGNVQKPAQQTGQTRSAAQTTSTSASITEPSTAPAVTDTSSTTSVVEPSAEVASTTTDEKPEAAEYRPPSFLTKNEPKEEPVTETPASGKSLFSGLTKPVNEA